MDVDKIVAQLGEASADELAQALSYLKAEAAKLSNADLTEDNVAKLEALGAARAQITGEQARRAELANRAAQAAAAFADDVNDDDTDSTDDTDQGDGDKPAGAETDEAVTQSVENAPPRPTDDGDASADGDASGSEGSAVTASGGKAKLGAIGRAAKPKRAAAPTTQLVTTRTTSLAQLPGSNATGAELDRWSMAETGLELHNRLARSSVTGKQYFARINFDYPEERILRKEAGAHQNSGKIEAVTQPEALTAAGGLCAPLETRYDINVLGVTNRPIRDALARFAVDRGGIQYRMPMDALVMTDGLGIWTVTDDEDNDDPEAPSPAKTCAVIECPDVVDAVVYSTYLCLQYPNFTARFDREWVDATTRAAMIAWARFAENQLLARILAGSKLIYQGVVVSATRDVLVALDKAVAYYRNRHRLDSMVPLRLILPRWVLDLFRADIARGFPGDLDALAIADTQIMGWFRARGVNVTFHLDGLAGATVNSQAIPNQYYDNVAAGSVIPEFIDKIDAALFAEGDWLYLDGGTLDLGLVRDSSLNRINRYQQFVENFEGVAFNGIESLRLVLTVHPRGAVVGTIPPIVYDDAGAVVTASNFPED